MASVFDGIQPLPAADVAASAAAPPPPPAPTVGGNVYGTQPVVQQQANSLPVPAPPTAPPAGGAMAPAPPPQGGAMAPFQASGEGDFGGVFNVKAPVTSYQQDVLSGKYLDLESNPWLKEYTAGLTQELGEEYEKASSQALSPFASAGGTLGFSGISAGVQARMADDYSENLSNQLAESYYNLYMGERQLQNQVSSDISNLQAAMYSVAGGIEQANIGANAQIESANIGANAQIESSNIGANAQLQSAITSANATMKSAETYAEASKYSSNLAYQLGNTEVAAGLWKTYESLQQSYWSLEWQLNLATAELYGGWAGNKSTSNPAGFSYSGQGLQGAGTGYGLGSGLPSYNGPSAPSSPQFNPGTQGPGVG